MRSGKSKKPDLGLLTEKMRVLTVSACNRHTKWEKTVDNPGSNIVNLVRWSFGVLFREQRMWRIPDSKCFVLKCIFGYFTGLLIPKESKMLTLANSDYLPQRDLRIWISAKSGL